MTNSVDLGAGLVAREGEGDWAIFKGKRKLGYTVVVPQRGHLDVVLDMVVRPSELLVIAKSIRKLAPKKETPRERTARVYHYTSDGRRVDDGEQTYTPDDRPDY